MEFGATTTGRLLDDSLVDALALVDAAEATLASSTFLPLPFLLPHDIMRSLTDNPPLGMSLGTGDVVRFGSAGFAWGCTSLVFFFVATPLPPPTLARLAKLERDTGVDVLDGGAAGILPFPEEATPFPDILEVEPVALPQAARRSRCELPPVSSSADSFLLRPELGGNGATASFVMEATEESELLCE